MQVWCDCATLEEANSSRAAECDACVLPYSENIEGNHYYVQETPDKPYKNLYLGNDRVGIMVDISRLNGQQKSLEAIGSVEWILVYASIDLDKKDGWIMIPAENLIGAATQTGTKIAFIAERAQDVMGLSQALQVGVDALCVASNASSELWDTVMKARQQRAEQETTSPPQVEAKSNVVSGTCWRLPLSSSSVVADRVCIDFVRNLSPTEGCWIGSSAKIMALVLSEAATSSFVPSRPFRVNAGPVHSYVCLANGKTKYLCELEAGDEVLVYDSTTKSSRSVAVGRLKIEVRPCVLVGLEVDADNGSSTRSGQIFLQQAETVRLGQIGGNFVRVTDLTVAEPTERDKRHPLLLRETSAGTHVGGRYDGKVDER